MSEKTVWKGYYQNPKTANLGMDVYAYNPPADDNFIFDGKLYKGAQDFRTVEQYRIYKDCGFNTLLAQKGGGFGDEAWETCAAKKVMDNCLAAGVEKVILLDEALKTLSDTKGDVIGENKKFKTEAELDAFVDSRMKWYRDHPAFFGVQLMSEPTYIQLKAVGEVYRSIKRVCPKAFVQVGLASMFFRFEEGYEPPYGEEYDYNQRYEAYVNAYFDETGADCVLINALPLGDGYSEGLEPYYFRNLQIVAKVAKKRGAQMHFSMQAFGQYASGKLTHRYPSAQEMNLQIHSHLGFGAKKLVYDKYWSATENSLFGAYSPDGFAIMNLDGTPAGLYPEIQRLNAMVKKLSPVIMNFEHVSDTYAALSPFVTKPMHIKFTLRNQLNNAELEASHEVAMAYELYDSKREQYLYVLQNITCPLYGKDLPKQTSKIAFNKNWTKADVFDGKEWKTVALVNGTYTAELENGEAVYLLPY